MVCIFKKLLEDLETLLNIIYLKAKKKLFFFFGFCWGFPLFGNTEKGKQNKTGLNTEQSELDVVLDQELIQGVPTTISVQDHGLTVVNHDPCFHEFRLRNQGSSAKIARFGPTTGT